MIEGCFHGLLLPLRGPVRVHGIEVRIWLLPRRIAFLKPKLLEQVPVILRVNLQIVREQLPLLVELTLLSILFCFARPAGGRLEYGLLREPHISRPVRIALIGDGVPLIRTVSARQLQLLELDLIFVAFKWRQRWRKVQGAIDAVRLREIRDLVVHGSGLLTLEHVRRLLLLRGMRVPLVARVLLYLWSRAELLVFALREYWLLLYLSGVRLRLAVLALVRPCSLLERVLLVEASVADGEIVFGVGRVRLLLVGDVLLVEVEAELIQFVVHGQIERRVLIVLVVLRPVSLGILPRCYLLVLVLSLVAASTREGDAIQLLVRHLHDELAAGCRALAVLLGFEGPARLLRRRLLERTLLAALRRLDGRAHPPRLLLPWIVKWLSPPVLIPGDALVGAGELLLRIVLARDYLVGRHAHPVLHPEREVLVGSLWLRRLVLPRFEPGRRLLLVAHFLGND